MLLSTFTYTIQVFKICCTSTALTNWAPFFELPYTVMLRIYLGFSFYNITTFDYFNNIVPETTLDSHSLLLSVLRSCGIFIINTSCQSFSQLLCILILQSSRATSIKWLFTEIFFSSAHPYQCWDLSNVLSNRSW